MPEKLPWEIFDAILNCVAAWRYKLVPDEDKFSDVRKAKRDLSAFCLASKELCLRTRPLLYKTVHIYPVLKDSSNSRLFLRTLLERPELACHVSHLWVLWANVFHEGSDYPNYGSSVLVPQEPELIRLCDEKTEHLKQFPWYDEWASKFKEGNAGAEVTLIATMLPRLERLIMGWLPYASNYVRGPLSYLAPALGSNPNQFDNLKEVYLSWWEDMQSEDYMSGTRIEDFSALFMLSNLSRFSARGAFGWEYGGWKPAPDQAIVQPLDLLNCDLDCDVVIDMIKSCNALQTLRLHFNPESRKEMYLEELPDILLSGHKHTLQNLTINTRPEAHDLPRLGVFRDFQVLRFLAIEEKFLLSCDFWDLDSIDDESACDLIRDIQMQDLIPHSLEHLVMINCGVWIDQVMRSLLNAADLLPNLRRVWLQVTPGTPEPEWLSSMVRGLAERNIEFWYRTEDIENTEVFYDRFEREMDDLYLYGPRDSSQCGCSHHSDEEEDDEQSHSHSHE